MTLGILCAGFGPLARGIEWRERANRRQLTLRWSGPGRPADSDVDRVTPVRRACEGREGQHIVLGPALTQWPNRGNTDFVFGERAGLVGAQHIDRRRFMQ